MAKKFTLNAAIRLTAMAKKKKAAEERTDAYSRPLFDHVLKLILFGDVQDQNKWLKEVRSACMEIHPYASFTTHGHLDPKWVYECIFLDFARSPIRYGDLALHMADMNPEYTPVFDIEVYRAHMFEAAKPLFKWLADALVDPEFRFVDPNFYTRLLSLIAAVQN